MGQMRPEELIKALSQLIQQESQLKDKIASLRTSPYIEKYKNAILNYNDQLNDVQLKMKLALNILRESDK